ncbi:MAG: CRISPR-associated ring nuclease [Nitrososphaeria archaeon]|nr:CRISPR-associated ring nuclease [Nitrososphaeria archaeon]
MIKNVVGVIPIGFSPPVATEFVQYVQECRNEKMNHLILIATSHKFVKAGVYLVIEALKDRYPRVRVHPTFLNFEDVNDENKMYSFLHVACKALVDQKIKYKTDIIHLCIAGGRKEESVLLTLLGQLVGVNTIMHFIIEDIRTYNIELERIKKEIEDILEAENKSEHYKKHKDKFEKIMFPNITSYSAIEIPILPYPKTTLAKILGILDKENYIEKKDVMLEYDIIRKLNQMGLIKEGTQRIYIKEKGKKLAKALTPLQKLLIKI